MKSVRLLILFCLLSSASIVTANKVQAEISICDYSGRKIIIATAVRRAFQVFSNTWTTRGWIEIENGCETISTGQQLIQGAFVAAFAWDGEIYAPLVGKNYDGKNPDSEITHFGEDQAVLDVLGKDDGEFWFCVTPQLDQPFYKQNLPYDNLFKCKGEEIGAYAFFWVWHSANTDFAEVIISEKTISLKASYRK